MNNFKQFLLYLQFSVILVDCAFGYARPLIECLGKKGIKASLQPAIGSKIFETLEIRRHRVAAVVLLDGLNLTDSENILQVV